MLSDWRVFMSLFHWACVCLCPQAEGRTSEGADGDSGGKGLFPLSGVCVGRGWRPFSDGAPPITRSVLWHQPRKLAAGQTPARQAHLDDHPQLGEDWKCQECPETRTWRYKVSSKCENPAAVVESLMSLWTASSPSVHSFLHLSTHHFSIPLSFCPPFLCFSVLQPSVSPRTWWWGINVSVGPSWHQESWCRLLWWKTWLGDGLIKGFFC